MNKDCHLIYEAFTLKSKVPAKLIKENNEEEDLPTRSHEIIAAIMPKDIDINGKQNENEFFNKAFPYVAKIIFDGDERRAQRYMYYDEDFNSDLISTYSYFQKHGFPKLRERDVERINRKMSGNKEETPQQYANDMEKDYPSQKLSDDEDAESYGMPDSEFKKLKLKKAELQIKKPSKELSATHPVIHDLAKQKYHELHSSEDAEGKPLTPYQQKIKDNDLKRKQNNEYNWVNSFHRTFGPGYKEELEKSGLDPYEMYVDYYGGWQNENAVRKFADLYNSKYPEYPVDIEKLLNLMHQSREKPKQGYKAPIKSEQEERRIDPKCWKGYHKQGTKLKDGKRVNNCVKNS